MKSTKIVSILALSLVACGGGSNASKGAESPASSEAKKDIKAPGDAKPGDTSRCPVSGEEFTVTADSPHVERDGKTYYFCCSGCKKKFESDPSKFTKS